MAVPDDLTTQLIDRIALSKKIAPETITPETTFDQLQIDSLDKINLTFDIEEAYAIEIPDSAISTIRTVADMIEGVRTLIAARTA
jgi:acyl carrier protein